MSDIFSADQIIDKSLFAKQTVPLLYDTSGQPFGYISAPDLVGKVYGWVNRPDGLYWQFYPIQGRYYYAKHKEGLFDIKALQEQGALNIEQVRELAEEKTKAWYQQIAEKALKGAGIIAAVLVAGHFAFRYLKK